MQFRTGLGFDVHRLEHGRDFWLGGIKIPHPRGAVGHSDADVLIHAICDSLFGAAGLSDIGHYFPDTSEEFKGIDSKLLLKRTLELITEKGFVIGNIDSTICLEKPKIAPFIPDMKKILGEVLSIKEDQLSIKATTMERLGFIGREEGVSAFATALLYKN